MRLCAIPLALALSTVCHAASESPFYLPIRNNDLAAIRKLIPEPGPKLRDARGITALEPAAGVNNLEVAGLLLAKGAVVNTADGGGVTPLIQAAWNGDRNAEMVKLLLDHGAEVNVKTGDTFEVVKNGPILLGH